MALRSKALDKAVAEVRELEERKTKLIAQLERADAELAQAREVEAAAVKAESLVLVDGGDERKVEKAREEAEARVVAAQRQPVRLRAAIQEFDARIERGRGTELVARAAAALEAHKKALRERNDAAAAFGKAVTFDAFAELEALEQGRAKVDETASELRALYSELELELPDLETTDEPSWRPERWELITEVIAAGPEQPRRMSIEAAERRERQQEQSDRAHLQMVRTQRSIPAGFPDRLRPQAEAVMAELRDIAARR
jgi:hypothetical protein